MAQLGQQQPKMKATELVVEAYRLWFDNLRLWLVALTIPALIDILVRFGFMQAYSAQFQEAQNLEEVLNQAFVVRALAMLVASVIASTLFAVAWHRFSLLGSNEQPTLVPRIGPQHVRFALLTLLLALIGVGLIRLSFALAMSGGGGIAAMLAAILVVILFLRWSMLFPGAAIGAEVTFGSSWAMTKGCAFTLFWAFVLCLLPMMMATVVIELLLSGLAGQGGPNQAPGTIGILVPMLITELLNYGALAVGVGVASAAYRRLAPGALQTTGGGHGG